jgi:hypothetical protein
MSFLERLLGKKKLPFDKDTPLPPGQDAPVVPVQQILKVSLFFEGVQWNNQDKVWVREELAPATLQFYWPELMMAIHTELPSARFGIFFAASFEESLKYANHEAERLGANQIMQSKCATINHPLKGACECNCTLFLYLSRQSSKEPVSVLIAPNHRLLPIQAARGTGK